MIQQKPTSNKITQVKSNQPFLLLNPQEILLVISGQVSVFATQVNHQQQPRGERHYLFDVNPGEIIWGMAITQQLGMLLVALHDVEFQQLSVADFSLQVAQGVQQEIARLEGWIRHLGAVLAAESAKKDLNLENTSLAPCFLPTPHSLTANQSIQPPNKQVIWIKVTQGKTAWQGFNNLPLEETLPWFPLVKGMWLTATCPTEINTIPTFEYGNREQLSDSLAIFHQYFCQALNHYLLEQKEGKFHRFQAREQLNQQLTGSALNKLTSVLQPQPITLDITGTPLLIAAGAIGRVQKIKVQPPPPSEDSSIRQNPLEAIARASQFRLRRVRLVGDWWQQEHGALLASSADHNSPLALLPSPQGKGYLLFDPVADTRTKVTATIAQTINTDAYYFYRPLPLVINSIFELFHLGITGYQGDIILVILIGTMATILGMVVPQATGMLIDRAIPDSDRLILWQLGAALFIAAFGRSAFQLSQGIITLRVESATDVNLQLAVWDRMLKIVPTFFREYTSGDLVNRLLAIRQIRSQLSGATQRTLLSGIFSLLNLGLMFVYSVKLALIALGIAVLAIMVTITSGIFLVRKERQQEKLDGEIDGLTVQLIAGVAKLRVAAAEERAFATWADKYSRKTKLSNSIQQINDAISTFNETLPIVSSVLLFWFAILFMQIAQGKGIPPTLTAGTFLAFYAAFSIFISGVTAVSNTLTDILGIVPLWERAKSLVQAPME